jgi:dTDP-4-amino-4,6-dideoxygalactose transaminase
MRYPFYSIPPAGNKIPIRAILRAIKESRHENNGTLLDPIKEYLDTSNLLFLSSGRAALWLILKTLAKLSSDMTEVVVPAYTCPAVVSAVLKAGLKPVLCDINLNDFGFSREELEGKVSKKTLAVVLVHLFGYPANIHETQEICREQGAFLVEDAAQAFGNRLSDSEDSKLGLLGDAGFFSFGRGKPISLMHGGILVTNSEEILAEAKEIYRDLNHKGAFPDVLYWITLASYSMLSNPHTYWIPQRLPFLHLGETIFEPNFAKSEGIQLAGALAGKMIESIEQEKEVRRANSEWYSASLSNIPWVEAVPSARFPYLRYPLLIKDREKRDGILDVLISQGTGSALFYPCPLNELRGLKEVLQDETVYPNARKLSNTLITLPVHSGVTEPIREKIKFCISERTRNIL